MSRVTRQFAPTALAAALVSAAGSCAVDPRADRPASDAPATPTAESRAVAFLSREIPRWSTENRCYSCHNNGDAARALYAAQRMKCAGPAAALADTTAWLSQPERWDHNGGEGPFSDKVLARLQFAAALVDAARCGRAANGAALTRAAELIVEQRRPDGCWQVEPPGNVGSPATWGNSLATYFGLRTLRVVDPRRWCREIEQAQAWLDKLPIRTTPDAAAVLLALADSVGGLSSDAQRARRDECIAHLTKGWSGDGGWGPYVNSPPEVFDTALAVLALAPWAGEDGVREMIRGGRAWLIAAQQPDGSWSETTRPPGGVSYAQRMSTTGWATAALLATRGLGE